ncbi:MAG: GAF domain-containing protein, partial [Pseudanabaenaceae cyanobacterium bins.39]|nr:GAF domain-containing protein [Pseudanabaenaceae cyanobacterium bins.39]
MSDLSVDANLTNKAANRDDDCNCFVLKTHESRRKMMIWTEILTTIRHFQISRQGDRPQDIKDILGVVVTKLLAFFDAEYVGIHNVHQIPVKQLEGQEDLAVDDRQKVIWETEVWVDISSASSQPMSELGLEDILLAPCAWRQEKPQNIFEICTDADPIDLSAIFTDKPYCVVPMLGTDGEVWGCLIVHLRTSSTRETRLDDRSHLSEDRDCQDLAIAWHPEHLGFLQQLALQLEILLQYEIQQSQLQRINEEMDSSYATLFHWTEQYRSLVEQVPNASYVLP